MEVESDNSPVEIDAAPRTEHSELKTERSKMNLFLDRLESAFRALWRSIAILMIFAIAINVFREVVSAAYTIEVKDVSEALVKHGIGKEVIATRIRAKIAEMVEKARDDDSIRAAAFDSEAPEIKIAGTEIPLRFIANEIKNLLGSPMLKISASIYDGENTCPSPPTGLVQNSFNLILYTSASSEKGSNTCHYGSLGDLIDTAALDILRVSSPIAAAGYLRNGPTDDTKFEALRIIDQFIVIERSNEKRAFHKLLYSYANNVPRALLMKAYILMSLHQDTRAEDVFEEARQSFEAIGLNVGQAYAYDGIAQLRILRLFKMIEENDKFYSDNEFIKSKIETNSILDKALKYDPNYDSARYHKAEVYAKEVIHAIIHQKDCRFDDKVLNVEFNKSDSMFKDFLSYRRNFSIAYYKHGELLINWLSFLQREESAACLQSIFNKSIINSEINKIYIEADEAFTKAAAYDESFALTWFKWGELAKMQKYVKTQNASKGENEKSKYRQILDIAIIRMNHAINELQWPCFGEYHQLVSTLRSRAALSDSDEERSGYLKSATKAACSYLTEKYKDACNRNVTFSEAKTTLLREVEDINKSCEIAIDKSK